MKQIYYIDGMTCKGCVMTVTKHLKQIAGVNEVAVDLEKGEATLFSENTIPVRTLKQALPQKYQLDEKKERAHKKATDQEMFKMQESKLQQLKPLLLILFYISSASILIHRKDLSVEAVMLDFMGLFYIVFSFFKLLDLKGFPASFSMYDPLAKRLPLYGKIYPFIELVLGLMFLMRFELQIALIATVLILSITTIGVTRSLLDKKAIRCACLGTALKLPMTEATFIENAIMIVMALVMLLKFV